MIFFALYFDRWESGKGHLSIGVTVHVVARDRNTFNEWTINERTIGTWRSVRRTLQKNIATSCWEVSLEKMVEKNPPLLQEGMKAIELGDEFYIIW